MGHITARKNVVRWEFDRGPLRAEDIVTVEEPLEIRVGGRSLTVTMRTPGNDIELAHGFLLSEGTIACREDVAAMRYCAGAVEDDETGYAVNTFNVLDVKLADAVPPPTVGAARAFLTSSSCGLCGKTSIDAVRTQSRYDVSSDHGSISAALLASLPGRLRAQQRVFAATGGLHAAGLVDLDTGVLRAVREDVGRHNAVDKAIGWAAMEGLVPLRRTALVVSSRASFELTQKAWMAGIPILAAVSAPSSLAIELARDAGMTLIGFLRNDSMVIYTGAQRVSDEMGASHTEPVADFGRLLKGSAV